MVKRSRKDVVDSRWEKKETQGRNVNPKFVQRELKEPVQAKNAVQKEFLKALNEYDVVVFSAPAGVGKSFLTMSTVADWLKAGKIDKLVLSRPIIPMGRSLGMLPSTLREKFEPHLMSLLEVLWKRYGKNYYDSCLHDGTIELLPIEYARGRSVDGAVVLDESQNLYPDEIYTMLTRMEEGSKLILIGDPNQTDIKGENGIDWLVKFVANNPNLQKHIKVIQASSANIVRSGLCKEMVISKEKELSKKKGTK